MGADLVHNLGDGEGREVLLKEKCLDDVVLRLRERFKDFPDDFLLGKVSNIERIDILNKHTILEYICSTPSSSFVLNSLSSTLSNHIFPHGSFCCPHGFL
jgi:hypothetical protein